MVMKNRAKQEPRDRMYKNANKAGLPNSKYRIFNDTVILLSRKPHPKE
jgi:hypothetical protein